LFEGEGASVVEELVEESLCEEADVGGGGEDSGVACYSAHAAGGGVVDGASEEVVVVGIGRGIVFGLVIVGSGGGVEDVVDGPAMA
jgi:hypothetical protein